MCKFGQILVFFCFFGGFVWAVFTTTSNSTPGAFCWKMSWAVKSPIGSALLDDPCRPYSPFKPWPDGYLGRDIDFIGGRKLTYQKYKGFVVHGLN